jgi:hypothetical protein
MAFTIWWPSPRLFVSDGRSDQADFPNEQAPFLDDRHDTAGFLTADQVEMMEMYSDKAEDRDQLKILFLEASEPRLRTARCVRPQELGRLPPISERSSRGCGAPKATVKLKVSHGLGPTTNLFGSRTARSL